MVAANTQAILDAALTLPEAERTFLVEHLLATLPAEPEEFDDDEIFAELERRRAEVEAGTAQGIPWSELKQED
jgi:putative addiction module component (TIGR02574 family)